MEQAFSFHKITGTEKYGCVFEINGNWKVNMSSGVPYVTVWLEILLSFSDRANA